MQNFPSSFLLGAGENRRIVVISPHYDDEVIGCGGTIAKLADLGHTIHVIYVTQGWSGIVEPASRCEATLLRVKEGEKSCATLGITSWHALQAEDRHFNVDGVLLERAIKVLRSLQPHIIFLPHPHEQDREHRLTHELFTEAIWLSKSRYLPNLGAPSPAVQMILLYEVWSPLSRVAHYEDITSTMSRKIQALNAHASQVEVVRWDAAIEGLNRYRAITGKCGEFAEAFSIQFIY